MKKLAIALGATWVFAGIAALYLWQELHTLREQNSAAVVRVTALESGKPGSPAVLPVGDGAQAAARIPMPNAPGPAATALAGRGQVANPDADPSFAQMIEKMMTSPEGLEMRRMMERERLEEEFPNLAKDMNLSPEKAEKLLDLLAKRRADRDTDDLGELRGARQDRAAEAELARSREESSRAYVTELKTLLGDNYPKWNDYEIAATERRQQEYSRVGMERLRNVITAGGAPLTDAQFEHLNSAITAEQKRIDRETTSPQQQMQRLPETNRRLVEVAAPHLNPQQLDQYKRYLEQQQRMMSAMDAAGVFADGDDDDED